MEEVTYEELDRWGWECSCKYWNELEDDPNYMDTVICDNCFKEYIPVPF